MQLRYPPGLHRGDPVAVLIVSGDRCVAAIEAEAKGARAKGPAEVLVGHGPVARADDEGRLGGRVRFSTRGPEADLRDAETDEQADEGQDA